MRFSVIVPVFDTAKHLAKCISALLAVDWPKEDREFILVDNNSTDDSPAILARTEGIRALQEPKQGSYAARNRGARESRGSILVFTDSDCIPDPDWLRAIDTAFEDPGCRVVLGARGPAKDRGLIALLNDYELEKDRQILGSSSPEAYYGFTNNMAVRKETFDRHGPFLEIPRGADTIFVRRVVDAEGCDAVRYRGDMRVTHAEMDGFLTYCRKMFVYGRSRRLTRGIVRIRPLRGQERLAVLRSCVRNGGYTPGAVCLSILALSAGLASWTLGDLAGRWTERARAR